MNKILKNFFSIGFANIVGQLATFLITAYYANIVGGKLSGEVTLAQSIWLYFSMVVLFGIPTYGTILVATNKDKLKKYIDEILSFKIMLAILSFLVIVAVALVSNQSKEYKVMLVIFGLTLFPMIFNIDWVYNGLEEMHHNAVYVLMKNLIPCIIILVFFKSEKNLLLIPFSMFIGVLFGALYQMIILHSKNKVRFKFSFDISSYKVYFYAGLPFLCSSLLAMVNGSIDKVIMGYTVNTTELGIYNAAYVFINFLISLSGLLFNPIFPSLVKSFNDGEKDKLRFLTSGISKVITMLVLPISVGGIILAKDIITFFFKRQEFAAGYIPFRILIVYILVLYIREIFAYQLNAYSMQKKYLKIVFVSATLNLILNLIFIPRYGMIGAALVTFGTEFINLIFMRYYAIKVVETKVLVNIAKVLVPALIMGGCTFMLQHNNVNLIINIGLSIIVYLCLLFGFKQLNLNTIRNLRKVQ